MDFGIVLKCNFELVFLYKIFFSFTVDLNGCWMVSGVHLFQFVYDFNEFS